jgi:hypothetical protein
MTRTEPQPTAAEIVREYGPFAGADKIHGVTHDGRHVWAATGAKLIAFDPESGKLERTLDRTGDAGTAFDGTHLYRSPRRASTRSIRQRARCSRRSRRPAKGETRVWHGPRAAYGSASIATARS